MSSFSTSEKFAALDPKDRDRLEALAKLDEFEAGREILASGDGGEWLYLIVSGAVEIRAWSPAREFTVGLLGPGDLLGELESFAALNDGNLRYVARSTTIVRAINKHPLKHELKAHRSLAAGLLSVYCRSISEKVRSANEAAVRLGTLPPGASRPPPAHRADRQPHLSDEEAAWLSVLGQPVTATEGDVILAEGDASRAFFVVESGELEVRKRGDSGQSRALARLGPRDMFGFMSFVDGRPRSASVVAVRPCRLHRIEPQALTRATQLNFTVSFKFLGTLCAVLGRTYRDTVNGVLRS